MTFYIIGGILLAIILFLWIRYRDIKGKLDQKNSELHSLHQQTQEQFQLQQDFISAISQELRMPLYGIMGLINLLAEEHSELKNDKKLKSLKFSGDYLLSLINNVLQVNYIDSEEIAVKNIPFDLKEVTQNLINSLSYATENSDNKLHYKFDSQIDQKMNGDPAILSQILMNLVSNALRFTKNGNVYFAVNLMKQKENTLTISFKINHDGYEVSKEDEKSIYREFINIKKTEISYLGTGLNATIVNRLAKAIQGDIIQNHTSTGSEYALIVDLEITKTDTTKKNKDLYTNLPAASKYKALIVDDNKLNLLVADKILSNENFDCTTVDNGFDAIDLVKENRYDVILMDINMPKLNGIGTTKRIREFNVKTPIIALTAVDITQLNRQIIQAGLNDYILKPYNKNQLLEMIYKYIENPMHN